MENWRNRKTLILEPHGHDGAADAGRIQRLRRASLPHAWRRPLLHGPEGPHRSRQISRRMGGDAVLHRGAGCGRVQMGIDPRAQPREVRSADSLLDPDLHPSRDRLSAGDLRRQLSHSHAHRRRGRGFGQMDGAQEFASKLAIVGAGHMAEGALATCNEVFNWEEVRVWSRTQATLDHFVKAQQPKYESFEITPRPILSEVVRGADVVVTVTPARGADRQGRMDRAGHAYCRGRRRQGGRPGARPADLQRARIFVDDIRQCRTDGEINVPLSRRADHGEDIAGEIGEVITGRKAGPPSDEEITLFDSTGIALQDSPPCRSNTSAPGRRCRHREEDDLDVKPGHDKTSVRLFALRVKEWWEAGPPRCLLRR